MYDQYSVTVRWSEPIPMGQHLQNGWIRDLPPGRFWNSYHQQLMLKEHPGMDRLIADAHEGFKEYIYGPKGCVNWGNLEVKVEFYRREVWMLEWFSHRTFDIGLTDAEVCESFHRYVFRTQLANCETRCEKYPDGRFCLMGAEDHWRWRGTSGRGGYGDEDTKPPCRCDSCKKLGLVRINH